MQISYIVRAIHLLKPNAEYSFSGEDYSNINWIVLEGDAPTKKEIDDAIKQVKKDEAQALINEAKAKTAAQAKLAALGLTVEDLTALGL
jgi:hypothetical protein